MVWVGHLWPVPVVVGKAYAMLGKGLHSAVYL